MIKLLPIINKILLEATSGDLLIVDIQPEYAKYTGFNIPKFFQWAMNFNKIYYLYNGADTVGDSTEDQLKMWIIEQFDYNEEQADEFIDKCYFYDKGYAFFRNAMDNGVDTDEIIALVQYMDKEDINDSRDIETEQWDEFIKKHKSFDDIRDKVEGKEDSINIPDVYDFIKNIHSPVTLVGGSKSECLAEVEIMLIANKNRFKKYNSYIY